MEVSSVVNSMQKFIDRLDGLNEEGRDVELKFKNIPLRYINGYGKDIFSDGWSANSVEDGFVISDGFMVKRTDEDEPVLYIKFTREQTQDFVTKDSEKIVSKKKKWFFFEKEEIYWTGDVKYPVTYTQEYWINVDNITIINSYKGKCS